MRATPWRLVRPAARSKQWAALCPAVAHSLEEAGLERLMYDLFSKNYVEISALHEHTGEPHPEFCRRTKTQASMGTENATLILLDGLVAFGQIQLQKIDGHTHLPSFVGKEWLQVA
jgi:hypothetical protein